MIDHELLQCFHALQVHQCSKILLWIRYFELTHITCNYGSFNLLLGLE